MKEKILYLFPDTNLFIQCKPLQELEWSEWSEFTEVHLIVCRPVTREIDNQKNRGNTRVAQRARSTYGLFAPLAENEQEFLIVHNSAPVVKIFLEGLGQPSPELKDVLDYNKTDDQIVGSLHRFLRDNPGADARLLTGDRGPMMAARSLGLPRVSIKETWLLPPEKDEVERENARLRQRVDELENAEPRFKIELLDEEDLPQDRLIVEHFVYEPLSSDDIDPLMDLIMSRFPKAYDFGPREPDPPNYNPTFIDLFSSRQIYTPAKDEEINRYSNTEYPNWIKACREALLIIYEKLQLEAGEPEFVFAISNDGTRPGKDALVNMVAQGGFKICAPPYISKAFPPPAKEPMIPNPPKPPRGHWSSLSEMLDRTIDLPSLLRDPFVIPPSAFQTEHRRDPNGLFYKPDRPTDPGDTITLECEQWRHGSGEKYLAGRIFPDLSIPEVQGALTCEVHAENLTNPVVKLIPVRITVKRVDSTEPTKALIEKLRYATKSK